MQNFEALYADRAVAAWGIPSPRALVPADGEFRALRLDWTAFADPDSGLPPPLLLVCADVLRLDAVERIDRPAFVVARRLELGQGASLAVDRIGRPELAVVVVTQEIVGPAGEPAALPFVAVSGADGDEIVEGAIELPPADAPARRAAYGFTIGPGGRLVPVDAAAAAAPLLADGSPLALSLGVAFQVASLVFTEDRDLARGLLAWVAELAAGSDRFADLVAEARVLLGRLDAMGAVGQGVMLAPRLDHQLYAAKAQALIETLDQRAQTVRALQTAAEDDQRWIDAVRATLDEKASETALAEGLEEQAAAAVSSAEGARMIAARDVREEAAGMAALRIDFAAGIESWKRDEQFKAAVEIGQHLFEIALELPTVFVAGPEVLAMPAAQTAMGLVQGLGDIATWSLKKNPPSAYLRGAARGRIEVWEKAAPARGERSRLKIGGARPGSPGSSAASLVSLRGSGPVRADPVLDVDDDDDDEPLLRRARPGRVLADADDFGFDDSARSSEIDFSGELPLAVRPLVINDDDADDDDDDLWSVPSVAGGDDAVADFIVIDASSLSAEDGDWVVLEDLSADPTKDFVLVDPDEKAALFAQSYNLDVKAKKARDARRQKLQDDLGKSATKILGASKGIFDAAMRINQIAGTAERLEHESYATLARVDLARDTAFRSIEPRGIDVVTGGAQAWDALEEQIENGFERMGELFDKIDGAREFRLAIRRLVRKGRAMSEARLALARANADLAAAKLRRLAAERAVAIHEQRLTTLAKAAERRAAMEQLAFGRVLDAKRAAWLAMEAYDRAAYYYELQPPGQNEGAPSITAPVDAFRTRARRMGTAWVTSARLVSLPQPFSLEFVLEAPDLGRRLAAALGVYSFDFQPDDAWFSAFYRVRLSELEVKVEGVRRAAPILVDIQTSGSYQDRMPDGSIARFVSDPYKIAYGYDPGTGEVITPARIAPRVAEDFFKPTPFTTWRLRFLDFRSQNPITLPGATAVAVRFAGTWSRRP